jgi:hypothetical protein
LRKKEPLEAVTKKGEEYRADLVVANAHVQTTMLGMVGKEHLG